MTEANWIRILTAGSALMASTASGLETKATAAGGDSGGPAWFGGRRMLRYNFEPRSNVSFDAIATSNGTLSA